MSRIFLSPAQRALYARMRHPDWTLGTKDLARWFWLHPSGKRMAAPGVRMNVLGALIRRGFIEHVPSQGFCGPSYYRPWPIYVVMFACNDPDTGLPSGHLYGAEVSAPGGGEIILEPDPTDVGRGPAFRWVHHDGQTGARVGRRIFPAVGERGSWTGNWCWDSCAMPLPIVRHVLAHLLSLGFTVTAESEHEHRLLPEGESFFDEQPTTPGRPGEED